MLNDNLISRGAQAKTMTDKINEIIRSFNSLEVELHEHKEKGYHNEKT
jgi:hypothetical protein